MPAVSLGKRNGPRISVICKENALSDVLFKLNELELENVASETRGQYGYVLADLGNKTIDLNVAGVIRCRILK